VTVPSLVEKLAQQIKGHNKSQFSDPDLFFPTKKKVTVIDGKLPSHYERREKNT